MFKMANASRLTLARSCALVCASFFAIGTEGDPPCRCLSSALPAHSTSMSECAPRDWAFASRVAARAAHDGRGALGLPVGRWADERVDLATLASSSLRAHVLYPRSGLQRPLYAYSDGAGGLLGSAARQSPVAGAPGRVYVHAPNDASSRYQSTHFRAEEGAPPLGLRA